MSPSHGCAVFVTSLIGIQRRAAAERSIASQTACTLLPCAKSGCHVVSGQPSSRSATWLAKLDP